MIKDILYKTDILNGLFTTKDFEFLKDSNNRQEEIEYKIKMSELKRNEIIEEIQKIDVDSDEIKNANPQSLKKYIDIAEEALKSANSIIINLKNILEQFEEIEKEILELVVKKESHKDADTDVELNKIYNKIEKYKEYQKETEEKNKKYESIVEKFLKGVKIENISVEEKEKVNKLKKEYSNVEILEELDYDLKDNLELRVSEKQKRVYLPYTKAEIREYLEKYPDEYKSAQDVINQEFIVDISIYNKHPVLARFREAYSLSRNKEMKSAIDSLKFALDLMFRSDINPTIIAAVKSQQQLEAYMDCLENNKLENFKYFTIIFEVNPI